VFDTPWAACQIYYQQLQVEAALHPQLTHGSWKMFALAILETGSFAVPAVDELRAAGGVTAGLDATALSRVDRVGSALQDDPFHRSVSWVVDSPDAQQFAFTGGDGVQRLLYQLPGEVNGKPGVFEWILDETGSNPVITHQRFIQGGTVTGYPNQVP
jgi:hypothetical protein